MTAEALVVDAFKALVLFLLTENKQFFLLNKHRFLVLETADFTIKSSNRRAANKVTDAPVVITKQRIHCLAHPFIDLL